jgi:hypothetical protein
MRFLKIKMLGMRSNWGKRIYMESLIYSGLAIGEWEVWLQFIDLWRRHSNNMQPLMLWQPVLYSLVKPPTLLLAGHIHLSSWRLCGELIELKIYWLTVHSAALLCAAPNFLTTHSLTSWPSNGTEPKAEDFTDICSALLGSSNILHL